ncbi:hypothetical protein TNCV_4686011 [Trichonephila clavipes]|nr:hypothetical protein TNCV_4686011 [Trichonephila clavipes]
MFPGFALEEPGKANLLLAKEYHEELMPIAANQSPSPASTLVNRAARLKLLITSLPQSSANALPSRLIKRQSQNSKPSEKVIALSNSFSAIAPIEENDEDF